MEIVKITQNDFQEWLNLVLKLCPEDPTEMEVSLQKILQSPRDAGFLVRNDAGTAIGFINLSLRYDYVPGATQTPVAYVEGIYVQDDYRRQGVGTYLIQYAQQWAVENGCVELASDALIDNKVSHKFHQNAGFQEVERVVTFIKKVTDPKLG